LKSPVGTIFTLGKMEVECGGGLGKKEGNH